MAVINLVTGYTGEAHVRSDDDALLNIVFSGGLTYRIINLTSTFNDTSCDIDCDAIVAARLMRTDGDITLTFTKPASGYYRFDNVWLVYTKDTNGIEKAELMYCEGQANANRATALQNYGQPTYDASVVDYVNIPIYEIEWDNAQTKTVTETRRSDYFDCFCAGAFTDSKTLHFTMPLPHSIYADKALTLETLKISIYYGNGTAAGFVLDPSEVSFINNGEDYVNIVWTRSIDFPVLQPCTVRAEGSIRHLP